jgi:transposase
MAWRRGQAYSQDLRDRILAAEGSARAVAAQFQVSVSYVVKARQRRERSGEITPGPQHSHTPRKLAGLHAAIASFAAEHADTTIEEFRAWLQAKHATYASTGLMWNTLDRLGLTFKKDVPGDRAGPCRCCCRPTHVARAATKAEPSQTGVPG